MSLRGCIWKPSCSLPILLHTAALGLPSLLPLLASDSSDRSRDESAEEGWEARCSSCCRISLRVCTSSPIHGCSRTRAKVRSIYRYINIYLMTTYNTTQYVLTLSYRQQEIMTILVKMCRTIRLRGFEVFAQTRYSLYSSIMRVAAYSGYNGGVPRPSRL